MCSGGSQPGPLFAFLPRHFRALSPRVRCPAPGRIGCRVHASDRHVFERHCARMWIRGSGAPVQALSSGRRGNAGCLAARATSARRRPGTTIAFSVYCAISSALGSTRCSASVCTMGARPRGSEQSQSTGRRYGVSARLHGELDEDAFDVGFYGLGGNLQLLSNAFVGESGAH
jgi:hypothetical protein